RLAGPESLERPRPDRPADEPQRRQADGGRHAAYLTIPAFGDREHEPRRRHALAEADRRIARPEPFGLGDRLDARGPGGPVAKRDAAAKRRERGIARLALDLRVIDLLGLEARMREARLKRARVRQHEQALAVVIEPSGGAHPGRI